MILHFVSVGVPALVYVITPKILKTAKSSKWLLLTACIIFFASWYLPSPLVDGMQTHFMTHFVGGGIFCGLLWLYIKLAKKWRAAWWIEAASLFALVSTLGVTSELFEFVLFKLGQMPGGIADTSYDLVANTLGALLVYSIYLITRAKRVDNSRD